MARTDRAQQKTAVEDSTVDTDGPALRGGHDQIVEEAPGVGPAEEMISPVGGAVLYDGVDGEPFDGVDGEPFDGVDGESFGTTLLDDLGAGSDLPDPTSNIDDQRGWAMDLPSGLSGHSAAPPAATPSDSELLYGLDAPGPLGLLDSLEDIEADPEDTDAGDTASAEEEPGTEGGSESGADDGDDERESQGEHLPGGDDDDDEDETESQGGSSQGGSSDGPRESQTMPAPDDGAGGDPEAGDFIGGRGDADPPPETENHGGGDLIGGKGDVDPDPDLDDAGEGGTIDLERLGVGVIDPLDGESTLLDGDTGDLAEMAAAADLGDVEIEFDDSLADADIGDDV